MRMVHIALLFFSCMSSIPLTSWVVSLFHWGVFFAVTSLVFATFGYKKYVLLKCYPVLMHAIDEVGVKFRWKLKIESCLVGREP